MITKKLGIFALALVPLAIGLGTGLAVPVDFIRDKIASTLEETQSDGHGHSHSHGAAGATASADSVDLTEISQQGMGLTTSRIKYSNYQSNFTVPAFVREIPGGSDLHVSSRFTGLVKRVFISEGQTVVPGQPILEIELTGDQLATAQAELLDAQKQLSIVEKEIARLEPSVRSGGVANKRLLDQQYERDRLTAKSETKSQELLVRGLTQEQIDVIMTTRKLLRSVTVRVPNHLIPPQLNAGEIMQDAAETFLVEQLLAKPGAMTKLGDNLCELSYHAVLVVEGQAYEKDLPMIRNAVLNESDVTIAIGPVNAEKHMINHRVAYLSNHVDDQTNTYPFYVYLKNESQFGVASSSQENKYVTWQWKPGQRAHVSIPDQTFEKQIVISRDALAIDGLKHYVFRWGGIVECGHDHAHDHGETDAEPEEHEHEIADKFEAIEVIVVHKDQNSVVIKLGDKLKLGDRIADNNASRLLFAMQAGNGGGGGHTHDH